MGVFFHLRSPWDTVLPATKINIRFINLSPDSDALSLQIQVSGDASVVTWKSKERTVVLCRVITNILCNKGGQTIASDVPYGVASDYVTLPPDTLTLELVASNSTVLLEVPTTHASCTNELTRWLFHFRCQLILSSEPMSSPCMRWVSSMAVKREFYRFVTKRYQTE